MFEAAVPLLRGNASVTGSSLDVDEVIFGMMRDYGYATIAGVAAIADVTGRTVRRHLAPLIAEGRVAAIGSTRDRRFVPPSDAPQERG